MLLRKEERESGGRKRKGGGKEGKGAAFFSSSFSLSFLSFATRFLASGFFVFFLSSWLNEQVRFGYD